MLLDLALPDASGLDLLREIREADGVGSRFDPQLPIIVLTGRGGATDRVRGLDLGADDYVQKPFSYEELRARITAVLRRCHRRREGPVRVGELLVDPACRQVMVGDREVHLAKKEFTLLRVLASDPTRVFAKDELLRDVWGLGVPAGRTRTLDSHASRLRRKLDPDGVRYVVNCWGIGYRLLRMGDRAVACPRHQEGEGKMSPTQDSRRADTPATPTERQATEAYERSLRRDGREALADLRADGLLDTDGAGRLLRQARALADLEGTEAISAEHLARAYDLCHGLRPASPAAPSPDCCTPARAVGSARRPRSAGEDEKGTP